MRDVRFEDQVAQHVGAERQPAAEHGDAIGADDELRRRAGVRWLRQAVG